MKEPKVIITDKIFKLFPEGIDGFTLGQRIFIKKGFENDEYLINHEKIHSAQYKELGIPMFIILYLWYFIKLAITKQGMSLAECYRMIPFEQEAYNNELDLSYLKNIRKGFEWRKYESI